MPKPPDLGKPNPQDDTPPTPPSIWRLIRAKLKISEMVTVNDLHAWIIKHRPGYSKPHLYRKLSMLTEHGLIKSAKWGSYSITQKGAEDVYQEDKQQLEAEDKMAPFVPGPKTIYSHAETKTIKAPEPQEQPGPSIEAIKSAIALSADELRRELGMGPDLQPSQQVTVHVNGHDVVLNLRIKVSVELA